MVAATGAAATLAVGVAAAAAGPLFPQCPPVGNNQGCSQLVVAQPNGSFVVQADPNAPASGYDGSEDTLIGFLNKSGHAVSSVSLDSPSNTIFGFDSDGICDPSSWPSAPTIAPSNCPSTQGFGPTGYEGPGNHFSNISSNLLTGQLVFATPVRSGGSAYFALEEALQAGQLLSGQGGHPVVSKPVVLGKIAGFNLGCTLGSQNCIGAAQLIVLEHLKGKAWVARRHAPRTRKVVVGSVHVSVPAGETQLITVSLSKSGAKLLKGVKALSAQLQVTLNGASGRKVLTKVGTVKFKGHH
jgi:hypothetical protein